MIKLNTNYDNLKESYLFTDIGRKIAAFCEANPDRKLIRMGIGDVTRPLVPAVVNALEAASREMGVAETFRGYGPEQGYEFLREAIVENDFKARGIRVGTDEIFVSDGAKSDTGNFCELLHADSVVAVTDPVYPVYVDSNLMAGHRIVKLPCTAENGFTPALPQEPVDVVYLCYPNNPTGTVLSRRELKKWVDYALANDALVFYDAAYEAFIQREDVPHSIYEIEGARRCAVEFHSFSKTAGFTGIRCGYTVVPKELAMTAPDGRTVGNTDGGRVMLNQLWNRRQCTKFNGTSYLSQRAAEAIYTPEGKAQVRSTIGYYMQNASVMREALTAMGFKAYGGEDAPYLWVATPDGMTSWEFFDWCLSSARVVCTPGAGFGPSGEGYVRLTAFGTHENTERALRRIREKI
mgnify:CR=1 FL=1